MTAVFIIQTRILKLADDREATERMKNNARNLYEEKFCAEKVYAQMVKFLEDNSLKN